MATGLIWDLLAVDHASPSFLKASASADRLAASTARAQKGVANWTAASARMGARLTKSLTLPLVAAAAVSVDQAAKYQKSLNTIRVATDQTAASMAVGSKGLLAIAKSTGTSLSQLTDSLYTATKSGQPMAKALLTVKAAAQGAKAENVDLSVATQALTSIMASYGKALGDPVAAENELIKGAGLAKTTYQDFAASLANVVPVAAALNISFSQVAGAVDTMTQHGETAQRATDNLSNLITNLAGQNNVASKALQQLGVNTIDLSKNLGKRGLTGSLDTVLNAMDKHVKGGLVVTSAFKQAAVATASLNTELADLPKSMQKNAKAFVDGNMSYKDFYAYTKSLGGQQFALAKDLITTQRAASGFNDQLKSGNSTTRTVAATLQKALGGVTGMRTALMLSGPSAKTFAASTAAVGKAAHATTGDVLGWSTTQDTLTVKMDKAKASMQVLAVEIGSKLIPIVTKMVDGVTKAVGWFDNLSSTDKKIIGWSAVTLAALGPILAIGARLGLAAKGLALFAGASVTTATTVATSMQKITTALIGAGIAYAGIQKGGTTGGIMAALGGGLTGASIGSFFGPVGTAIGGLTGLVGGLALSYEHAGNSGQSAADKQAAAARRAQAALQAQKQAVDALTTAIQNDSDAIGANTRAQVNNDLQKSGALKLAQQLNINPALITSSASGSKSAQAKVNAQLNHILTGSSSLVGANGSALKDATALTAKLAAEGIVLGKAGRAADLNAEGMGKLSFATRTVRDETVRYGTSLDNLTIAGRANTKFITDHVNALNTELSKGKLTNAQWATQVTTLESQLKQYGFNTAEVRKFIATLGKVPTKTETKLNATDGITPVVTPIGRILNSLVGRKNVSIVPTNATLSYLNQIITKLQIISRGANGVVTVTTRQGTSAASHYGYASGTGRGGLPEGVSSVGERGAELAIKRGNHVDILSHPQSKAYLAATGMKAPGFAGGTITHSGKDYIYGGTRYASLRAAENAQNRASTAASKAHLAGAQGVVQDVALLNSAFRQSSADIKTTTRALIANSKAAGASSRVLSAMGSDASRLATMANRGAGIAARLGSPAAGSTAYDRLATAQGNYSGERSNVAAGIVGQMDLTQAGPLGIAATVAGQVNSSRAFLSNLKTLKARGLDATDLDQLAQKGPAGAGAAVSQLLGMSGSQLATIGRDRAQLNTLGGQVGTLAAQGVYGAQVASAQKQVDSLIAQQKANEKTMQNLTVKLDRLASLVPAVDVYIDGKHATAHVARAVARQR